MGKINLDVVLASPMGKKSSSGWWEVGSPPDGFVFVHDVVRSVFGTAYVPFGIIVVALGKMFGRDAVDVLDPQDRRVSVKSDDVLGSVVRPCPEDASKCLAIRSSASRDLEVQLWAANEEMGSTMASSSSWKRSGTRRARSDR
jgi:hypothetical protein